MTRSLRITYVGHATLLIEVDGVRLLTDPILRNQILHLRRNKSSVDEAWYQNIDAVLISHQHWDHLDFASLKLLADSTQLLVPRGTGPMFERRGFQQVRELTAGKSVSIRSVNIEATEAVHDGARFRFGPPADCLGFLIHGPYSIYFAGDTDLFPDMANLADRLDIALLPVWGWGPTLGAGHLDPYRAAMALQMLEPRLAIPIHWGTLHPLGFNWLNPSFLIDPPHSFARHAASLAPEVSIQILPPGGSIEPQDYL
jgi:L-ascorbate metabolism protein UlaG (beta-lactamase superfamily)